jgi:hypothetical protein
MNKKIYMACGAAMLAMACSEENLSGTSIEPNTVQADGGVLWDPLRGDYRVRFAASVLALPSDVDTDGRWYWESYSDAEKGGVSYISWPQELAGGVDSLSPVIESCQGVCGKAVLKKGSMADSPFAGVGFAIAKDKNGKPVPVNALNWDGICMTYTSEADPLLVLDLGDSLGRVLGDELPSVTLAKSNNGNEITKCVGWDEFGEKSASQLVGLKFRIQADSGEYKFNVKRVETKAQNPLKAWCLDISSSSVAEIPESSSSSQIASPSSWLTLEGGDGSLWTPLKDKDNVPSLLYTFYDEDKIAANSYRPMEQDGRWFLETDVARGGESSIVWPVSLGEDSSLAGVVEFCNGLCGRASLKKGSSENLPAVSVGFNLAKDQAGNPTYVDVWNWRGICVEYYSEADISVELVLPDYLNELLEYNLPAAKLSKSLTIEKSCLSWNDFRLPEGLENVPAVLKEYKRNPNADTLESEDEWESHVGEQASLRLVGVKFKIQSDEGDYNFGIGAIGSVFREFKSNTDLPICISEGKGSKMCEGDLMSATFGMPRVRTDLYVGGGSWPANVAANGIWFVETDAEKGGNSSVSESFVQYSGRTNADTLELLVDDCLGVCRSMDLRRGTMAGDPYVVFGFNLAGEGTELDQDSTSTPVPVDVSNWGGMCLAYFTQVPVKVELDMGDSLNAVLGSKPYVLLPETEREKCVRWSDFELPAGQDASNDLEGTVGEFASKHLSAVRFVVQSPDDRDLVLNIRTISSYYF